MNIRFITRRWDGLEESGEGVVVGKRWVSLVVGYWMDVLSFLVSFTYHFVASSPLL